MKKTLFLLAAILMGMSPLSADITVSSPATGNTWSIGETYTIRWLQSGVREANIDIRLRVAGSNDADPPALAIIDDIDNDGTYSWLIPAAVEPGTYFIRVKTDTIVGDSGNFRITAASHGESENPRCDLEMPGVGVEYYNGQVVAWVKNNGPDSLRDHDVKFRLNFPERGGGEQILTRRITVPIGAEEGVQLLAMTRGAIPDAGLRTIVSIDTALSHIQDANRLNQHRDVRLYADNRTPIDLAISISNQRVTQVIGGGDLHEGIPHHKYRLHATLHLRNNSSAPAEITRVSCRWKEQYHTDSGWTHNPETHAHGTLTLGPFRPGEDITREIELEYKTYTFEMERRIHFELDPDRLLNDPNRGNNEACSVTYNVR